MRKLRERVPPARWRRFHFRICGMVICMILLYFGLEGSPLDLAPILIALALIVLDWVGCLLFFRCPSCGAQLWQYWSGHCHWCGEYIDFRREEPR